MKSKLFEVRDSGTFIPCIGIRLDLADAGVEERYLLRRAGYNDPLILFGRLGGGLFAYDEYDHKGGARTMKVAHRYILENWDSLESGAVVDVQFVTGESATAKVSERITFPID